ncbi:nuclear transport factor 2 family protein [Pseudomaricurvus sp. HS19]|uniref:nuclear transport factor 2 family protein n=1 Tax=Pseudomaricurvus sp. HS19 TaxID=2692626 RepID=UPI00137029BD|nr:nuclear transport factor 2 family protein [Pseudomaricurvus sp. HS19]MYM64176.1 nuclear transport factor 2 family protein [Pseudomaricurvus sp. HS19]
MTLDELLARESIRRTMARYTTAGDRLKVEEFRAVFTADGILQSEGVSDADSFYFEGREAIGGWLQRWLEPSADQSPKATFVRHHLATCDIELTGPDSARARTYWTAYTDIGADHGGYYLDEFRKQGDEWLIAHRRVRMDWRAPNSLFVSAVSRTR